MEHMAWKGRIKPGCKAEYQRRHAEIWPEMVKVLKDAGICNYSIFIYDHTVNSTGNCSHHLRKCNRYFYWKIVCCRYCSSSYPLRSDDVYCIQIFQKTWNPASQ